MSSGNAAIEDDDQDTDFSGEEAEEDDGQDDEATLDEEERLENEAEIADELAALHQEQDLPLEDLIKMYGCGGHDPTEDEEDQVQLSSSSDSTNNGLVASSSSSTQAMTSSANLHNSSSYSSSTENLQSSLVDFDEKIKMYFCDGDQEGSDNDDDNYEPNYGFWRKIIRIGSEYQAEIPESPAAVDQSISISISTSTSVTNSDAAAASFSHSSSINDESRDLCSVFDQSPRDLKRRSESFSSDQSELIWTPPPDREKEEAVEHYLRQIYCCSDTATSDDHIHSRLKDDNKELPDNESALRVFYENNYDTSKALKFRVEESNKNNHPDWTAEEIEIFENSLKEFGKNFHAIKQRLENKSVSDVVNFYYYWKKSDMYPKFAKLLELEYNQYLQKISLNNKLEPMNSSCSQNVIGGESSSVSNDTASTTYNAENHQVIFNNGESRFDAYRRTSPIPRTPLLTYRIINRGGDGVGPENIKIKWINNKNRIYSYYSPPSSNFASYNIIPESRSSSFAVKEGVEFRAPSLESATPTYIGIDSGGCGDPVSKNRVTFECRSTVEECRSRVDECRSNMEECRSATKRLGENNDDLFPDDLDHRQRQFYSAPNPNNA